MKGRLIIVFVSVLTSCVYPFDVELGTDANLNNILVVEGTIIPGEISKFTFSRLAALTQGDVTNPTDKVKDVHYVDVDIEVMSIIDDQDRTYYSSRLSIGNYEVDLTDAPKERRYKLSFLYKGESFETELLDVIQTSKIDSITWKANDYDGLYLYLSASGEKEHEYYRWSYVENWELVPNLIASNRYDPETGLLSSDMNVDPKYYCWSVFESDEALIEETTTLNSSVIKDKLLKKIHYMDKRLSYLYHIEVTQISISKESFKFWDMMNKNDNDLGGLFSHMPTSLDGNISCTTNPEIKVIGYIDASTTNKKSIFVKREEHRIYKTSICETEAYAIHAPWQWPILWERNKDVLYVDDMALQVVWVDKACVDCRTLGGTKNKPSFWPNDHF